MAYLPRVEFPHTFVQIIFQIVTSVCARMGTTMPCAPRSSRQFDLGYFSQIGMFPQAPILTGDHPYPRCLLACMLCCVFGSFVSLIFEPLLQYIPVCLTDSPPPASVTYPSVNCQCTIYSALLTTTETTQTVVRSWTRVTRTKNATVSLVSLTPKRRSRTQRSCSQCYSPRYCWETCSVSDSKEAPRFSSKPTLSMISWSI